MSEKLYRIKRVGALHWMDVLEIGAGFDRLVAILNSETVMLPSLNWTLHPLSQEWPGTD